jgi:1-acylglycerone phosphate reductase
MSQEELGERAITAEQWATEVSTLLLRRNPPAVIWRGQSAMLARVTSAMPSGMFQGVIKRMTKLNVVEEIIKESRR